MWGKISLNGHIHLEYLNWKHVSVGHLEPLSGDAKSISHILIGFIILVFDTALFLNSFLFCSKNCPRGSCR